MAKRKRATPASEPEKVADSEPTDIPHQDLPLAHLTERLVSEKAENERLKEENERLLREVDRGLQAIARLERELNRATPGTRAQIAQQLEEAEAVLRTIAGMRGSLAKRPANWYLAHECVSHAEGYFADKYALESKAG